MSGSEIVGKIERETGGKWKPSPGSIYPLLGGLQEKGFTQESSTLKVERGNILSQIVEKNSSKNN